LRGTCNRNPLYGPGLAIEPERREVIVTHNRVWDGYAYKENFVPSDHAEMLLLSDKDNAVAFVRTQEYYWPLARQKYVAFDSQREEILGTLRIFQDGKIVSEIEPAPYVVIYPEGAVMGDGRLEWGKEAIEEFARYQQEERDFMRAFTAAQRAQTAYNQALLEAGAARIAGEGVKEVEAPPPPPEPSLKLVTEPQVAYRVALPAGSYEMAIFVADDEVADSRKVVRVIEADAREVAIAEVVPEERWTRPIPSNTSKAKIYTTPGAVFYSTLSHASRFDEAEYSELTRPQAASVEGRDIWIKRRLVEAAEMQIAWNGDIAPDTLTLSPIKVEQTQGAEFGYVVRAAAADEKPDLQAFTIAIPESESVTRGNATIGGPDGVALAREIVVVQPRNAVLSWGLALLPAAFGFAHLWRRRRLLPA
jgi:hypothetical protein